MRQSAKRTKVLCTLGPATDRPGVIDRMLRVGMDMTRINMSHGTHDDHASRLRAVRAAAQRLARPVGVLTDLQGPKLRLGDLGADGLTLTGGQTVQLGGHRPKTGMPWLPTPFRRLARELSRGDTVLLADGAVELRTTGSTGMAVTAQVVSGGRVESHQGINIPGRALSIAAFTPKDKADLAFAVRQDTDFVALSFVRSAADVKAVRRALKRMDAPACPIIAKIEKPQALDDIDNIIDTADGIMVARGDLGVELSVEQVPGIQKTIIHRCAAAGKWVIVATQMLESMIKHATPTRAEASDVANAVYDGADCVMLSAETAVGRHPVTTVATMARICAAAESSLDTVAGDWGIATAAAVARRTPDQIRAPESYRAIAEAALVLLEDSNASALWVFTESGRTARVVSKMRPAKPVCAFSPHERTLRYLSGLWGIRPLKVPTVRNTDSMVAAGERAARKARCARRGDRVIVLAGQAPTVGATDIIKVHLLD